MFNVMCKQIADADLMLCVDYSCVDIIQFESLIYQMLCKQSADADLMLFVYIAPGSNMFVY